MSEDVVFFPYAWHIDEKQTEVTSIRIYGLNEQSESVCVRVDNFTPYIYLELPTHIEWTIGRAQMVVNHIDNILKDLRPLRKELQYKKRLYYSYIEEDEVKRFPYLKLYFSNKDDYKNFFWKIRRGPLPIAGLGKLEVKIHENRADPILQFTCTQNIPTAGWIHCEGKRLTGSKITLCDHEYQSNYKSFEPVESTQTVRPIVLSYDIEVNSSNPSAMPNPDKPEDKVFQISCILGRFGSDECEKYLLTLGEPDPDGVGEDVEILMFETEADLLEGFTDFVREHKVNVLIGYNILGFDIQYMIKRARFCMCISEFNKQGFPKNEHAKVKTISWSSSAYGKQEFEFLNAEGRLFVDMLPLIRRDFRFANYQLKTVSQEFLGESKDPLSAKGIFKCYRIGMYKDENGVYTRDARRAMAIVGKYCLCSGTQISRRHGTIPIEKMFECYDDVLSWNETSDKIELSAQSNFFDNGEKECIELEFEDGRKLVCTPDHQLATSDGWVEAGKIPINARVKAGPVLPEIGVETRQMIIARIHGYLLTDGHVGTDRCRVYIGNILDAENFSNDVHDLCGILPSICKGSGDNCFHIDIPAVLRYEIMRDSSIRCGNRTYDEDHGLPCFVNWSDDVTKEFLGGLFGGDGHTPSISKKDDKLTSIGFTQSRYNRQTIVEYMEIIQNVLLEKFSVRSNYRITDREGLFIGTLSILMFDSEKFLTTIGYRYCYHKTLRASAAVIYFRLRDLVQVEKRKLYDYVIEQSQTGLSRSKAYRQFVESSMYGEWMPCLSAVQAWCRHGYMDGRPDQVSQKFPKATEFMRSIGAFDIFKHDCDKYHTYALGKDERELPVFALKLVSRKNIGIRQVYDIEVQNNHSLLANGIVAHNCVQDSVLVFRLFNRLQTWYGLTEMASTCNVPIFTLYTQGQQIKVYSQIYKECMHSGYVVDPDNYKAMPGKYKGATVFPPVPGVYDRVVPFDFCLVGDTLVSTPNGTSKHLMSLGEDSQVLGYLNDGCSEFSVVGGLQEKGERMTVKLFMQDGRTITCTPDHRLMLSSGEWKEAQNIDLEVDRLVIGPDYPEDVVGPDEQGWCLDIPNHYTFTMDTPREREKTLALMRIIGYALTDGSIYRSGPYQRQCCELYLGTQLDAELALRDIELLGFVASIRFRDREGTEKGSVYSISLPQALSTTICSIDGIMIGKRASQETRWPSFLLTDNCPLSVLREFMGGLFGGDGTAPYISQNKGDRNGRTVFGCTCFKWTIIERYLPQMVACFEQMKVWLQRFGIESTITTIKIKYGKTSIKPQDYKENPRHDVQLAILYDHMLAFGEKIGFRYCLYKSCRSSVTTSYQRLCANVRRQHELVVKRAAELYDADKGYNYGGKSTRQTLEIAQQELLANEPAYNERYSLATVSNVGYWKHEKKHRKPSGRRLSLQKRYFPDAVQYAEMIGALKWFNTGEGKVYCVDRESVNIPCYNLSVLDRKDAGLQFVFDIEVNNAHSFLANGAVVHNCSLYPTTIISHNIDPSTFVIDDSVPDELCHVIEWDEHDGCEHDPKEIERRQLVAEGKRKKAPDTVTCMHHRYRFLKEPAGIYPTTLRKLLEARRQTRKEIGEIKEKMKNMEDGPEKNALDIMANVLDKRQLAYKVSANSMYGSFGVQQGRLPFREGAMSTTARGRQSIEKVADFVQKKYEGKLIYGDTDSNYCCFPKLSKADEIWDNCIRVAAEISKLFPPPMELAFENVIYWRFMILTKKRYMSLACGRDGVVSDKISKKGVLLARRDNSKFVRDVYAKIITMIFHKEPMQDVLLEITDAIQQLFGRSFTIQDFVITKAVGDTGQLDEYGHLQVSDMFTEKNIKKGYIGQYKIKVLPMDPKEREHQLILKNAFDEHTYYERCLPAQVQLAMRMRRRGTRVDTGTRLEYVVTTDGTYRDAKQGKQYSKVEDVQYFKQHADLLRIDYYYYLKALATPLDQVLQIIYHLEKYTENLLKIRFKYLKVIEQLKATFGTHLVFNETTEEVEKPVRLIKTKPKKQVTLKKLLGK